MIAFVFKTKGQARRDAVAGYQAVQQYKTVTAHHTNNMALGYCDKHAHYVSIPPPCKKCGTK